MNKTLKPLIILISLFAFLSPTEAHAWWIFGKKPKMTLDQGLNKALKGKTAKFVNVDDHIFHIHAITVSKSGDKKTITGRISHHLGGRPDDDIYYTVVKTNGKVTSKSIRIERGGVQKVVVFLKQEKVAKLFRKGAKFAEGDWEGALNHILVHIVERV